MSPRWELGRNDASGAPLYFSTRGAAMDFLVRKLGLAAPEAVSRGDYYIREMWQSVDLVAGPPPGGIWKWHRDEWQRVEIVECTTEIIGKNHARLAGEVRTLCGRQVTRAAGITDTDTPRDIHCVTCKGRL